MTMQAVPAPALRAGEEPHVVAFRLRAAHQQFAVSHRVPSGVRPVVAASWRRCAGAGLSCEGRPPPVRLDSAGLAGYRSGHPLAVVLPLLREVLGTQAGDCGHIFGVTDAAGLLLWVEGDAVTRRRAEQMNFAPGTGWSEADAGTNAPGTALTTKRPVQVFAAEHYSTLVHAWSCAAAPVRDPVSGQVLGAIDITGGEDVARPHALALIRAAARLAEAELARHAAAGGHTRLAGSRSGAAPGGPVPQAATAEIRLTALGRDCALAGIGGRTVQLRPRHSEIAVILALAAGGLAGPCLAVRLSAAELAPVTLRAEMSRLRALVGDGLLGSHPYEFRRPVSSDFSTVLGLLAQGRVADAVAAYAGPLLPSSQAPAIAGYREALAQQLRGAVLASGDAAPLRQWVNAPWGAEDPAAWLALATALPAGSPQRAAAEARAEAIDEELAVPAGACVRGAGRRPAGRWAPARPARQRDGDHPAARLPGRPGATVRQPPAA
jgi:GAF domain